MFDQLAQFKYHNDECSKKFKALTFIHQSVSDAIFPRILGAQTAKEAWDKLRDEFQGSERVRSVKLLTLKREFEMLRMKEGETINESAFQLKQKGKPTPSKNGKKFSYEKQEKSKSVENSREEVRKGKFPPCSICKRTNHLEKDCWHKGKPVLQCWYCKKHGHIEKFYKAKQNKEQQEKQQSTQHANSVENQQQEAEEHLFMASHHSSSFLNSSCTWFIDSGCTVHMAKDADLFSSLDSSIKTKVKLANGQLVQVEGKGTISIYSKLGTNFIFDVLLVPGLNKNLLSVAQLLRKKYFIFFKDESCIIYDSTGVEIAKVTMIDNCFPFDITNASHHVYNAADVDVKL
ncbi:uncharacterized protein LOC110611601 [Manihot esculenta]|uniref:uncharacterized protein LOC110611601 n=1 Tax=Manihot esculenta TaxID=3983 RepID=UPI000B5D3816|nr:uncharacterized protein LOC110611601 [Manihot esculenta]